MSPTTNTAPKLRITIAAVIEYEANPAHYEDCSTPEDMLAADVQNAEDDPFSFLGGGNNVAEWKTTGEIVGEAPAAASGAQCWACPDCHLPEGCVIGQCTIGCKPPAKEAAASGVGQPERDETAADALAAAWASMHEFCRLLEMWSKGVAPCSIDIVTEGTKKATIRDVSKRAAFWLPRVNAATNAVDAAIRYLGVERGAALAAAPAAAPVHDAVWEALQRMIEDGMQKGAAGREDALAVARQRDRVLFMRAAAPQAPAAAQAQPLTDERINSIAAGPCWHEDGIDPIPFARAIERAHGIGGAAGATGEQP